MARLGTNRELIKPYLAAVLLLFMVSVLLTLGINYVWLPLQLRAESKLGYTSVRVRSFDLPQVIPQTAIIVREAGEAELGRDEYLKRVVDIEVQMGIRLKNVYRGKGIRLPAPWYFTGAAVVFGLCSLLWRLQS
jgi:hypothetical protein